MTAYVGLEYSHWLTIVYWHIIYRPTILYWNTPPDFLVCAGTFFLAYYFVLEYSYFNIILSASIVFALFSFIIFTSVIDIIFVVGGRRARVVSHAGKICAQSRPRCRHVVVLVRGGVHARPADGCAGGERGVPCVDGDHGCGSQRRPGSTACALFNFNVIQLQQYYFNFNLVIIQLQVNFNFTTSTLVPNFNIFDFLQLQH
jgi:hypothetical protein